MAPPSQLLFPSLPPSLLPELVPRTDLVPRNVEELGLLAGRRRVSAVLLPEAEESSRRILYVHCMCLDQAPPPPLDFIIIVMIIFH